MAESDTIKSSAITDHPFIPRGDNPYLCAVPVDELRHKLPGTVRLRRCNMAEAAHRETTVKR